MPLVPEVMRFPGDVSTITLPPTEDAEIAKPDVPVTAPPGFIVIEIGPLPVVAAMMPFVPPDTAPKLEMMIEPAPETEVLMPLPPGEVIVPALMTATLAPVDVMFTPVAVPDIDMMPVWTISVVTKSLAVLSVDPTLKPTPPDPVIVDPEKIRMRPMKAPRCKGSSA